MKVNIRVGIDVGAKELVVKIEKDELVLDSVHTFDNTTSGHKKLVKLITKHKSLTQVCMEATGVYHFDLALLLDKTEGVEVMVVNPKVIKHFSVACMQRSKTDPLDALTILEYLRRMPFVAWQAPEEKHLEIQGLSRRIHQLKSMMQQERCRRHAGDYKAILGDVINRDIEVNMRHLKKRIQHLEKNIIALIQSNAELKQKYELLMSIKGIGATSAIQIISELICLPEDMRAKQWVAYAGLDPRATESGSSIKKARRISKAGNKYLRTALYMPAWVAVQTEPRVTAFYQKLIAAGKKPMQAIVAVMRKLLHAIWGVLQSKTAWQPDKFYRVQKV